ncbi:MAG: hypothetical protein IJX69_05095 [Oscillospiraceae bacterium]|nr:hypothetical protein [Oscillospiraceae bacterium]
MICKWCGESIETTASRCPKCGRETPAMSDCGGFYKLKTGGDTGAAAPQTGGPIKLPQLDKLGHMYVRDMKQTRLLQLVGLGAMVLTVLLLIVTLISVGGVNARLKAEMADDEDQSQHQEDSDGDRQDDEGDPDDDEGKTGNAAGNQIATNTEKPQVPLTKQDAAIGVTLFNSSESGGYMDVGYTLEGQEVSVWTHTERNTATGTHKNTVICDLNNGGDCLTLTQHDKYAEEVLTVSMYWDAQGEYFSGLEFEKCTWEYRFAEGPWQMLERGVAVKEDETCSLALKKNEIKRLLAGENLAELRCTITFKHADGGTLTITLDGLLFGESGVAANGVVPFEGGSAAENQNAG